MPFTQHLIKRLGALLAISATSVACNAIFDINDPIEEEKSISVSSGETNFTEPGAGGSGDTPRPGGCNAPSCNCPNAYAACLCAAGSDSSKIQACNAML